MNVYEYFQHIRKMDMKILNAQSEIERLNNLISGASAVDYSVDRVQNGKTEKEPSFVNTLDKIEETRMKLHSMIEKYETYRAIAFQRLDVLTPLQQRVIFLRYFEYKNLEKVAEEMHYSFVGCRKIYRSAIRKFREEYGDSFEEE